jgi:thymidylate synthase-like protein
LTTHFSPRKLLIISIQLKFASLGRAWINVVNQTLQAGTIMGNEGYECLGVEVGFPAETGNDEILGRFADAQMVADMQKVFFGEDPNPLGHSYASLIRGPAGRSDLADVIELLGEEAWSKRAVVTLCGEGNGNVPCINVIQFLVRNGVVQTFYFARGQDAFRKLYADGLCIASMARTVARGLRLPAGTVTGFIGSCHIYHRDVPAIREMLEAAKDDLALPGPPVEPGSGPLSPALSTSEGGRTDHQQNDALENARNRSEVHGGTTT